MRVLRIFVVSLSALVGLMLLLSVGVIVVNLRDQALDPLAKGYLDLADPSGLASDDPAFAFWAFDAPKGVDPVPVGRAVWKAYEALGRANPARLDWTIHAPYPAQPFQFPLDLACADAQSACVSTYLAHASKVKALVKSDQYLLDRLATVDTVSRWHEVAPPASPGVPIARLTDVTGVFSLSLAQASVEIEGGQLAQGVAHLEQDTRIARRILGASDSLLSKMMASAMLRRTLLVYSELLSAASGQPPILAALNASLARSAGDLDANERSLLAPMHYEARTLYNLTLQLVSASTSSAGDWRDRLALWGTPFLLLPRATANLEASLWEVEAPMMRASTNDFGRNQRAIQAQFAAAAGSLGRPSWRSVYNPLGKIFASNAPDLTEFAARVFDDDVLMHAVKAKAHLMTQGVRFDQAARFLQDTDASCRDPYSGAAFSWRPAEAAIVLPGRGTHAVTLVRVPLRAT